MTAFIHGDMRQCVQYVFSILFPAADTVRLFGDNMKLSRIPEVTQEHCRLCLIINLVFQPDEGMPSVNDTTEREVSPESMQFERAFPRILQAIWEADPDKGSVQVSNMDMKDAYHHGMLRPSQVGGALW